MKKYLHKLESFFKKDKRHFQKVLGLSFLVVIFVFTVFYSNSVKSSLLDNVSGYAWGAEDWTDKNGNGSQDSGETMFNDLNGNGIQDNGEPTLPGGAGWISFNCTSGGNCGSADYGVNVDTVTGHITGYAWSSNYGWLKFGGLSGFPASAGTLAENAKVNLITGVVTGWARFCSPAASPDTCIGSVSNLSNGGWDGWVSLRSTVAPTYGVTLTGSDFSGYAWGGNSCAGGNGCGQNVVGWLSFNCSNTGGCGTSNYKVTYMPVGTPTVTVTATPANVPTGGSTVISWEGTNLISSPTGCTTTGGTGAWPGTRPSPTGSFNTGVLPNGTYNYSIQCVGSDGITLSNVSTVQVVVGAVTGLDFYADPAVVYPPSYSTELNWNALNGPLTNCVANSASPLNPASVPGWQGAVSNPPFSQIINVPYPTTAFMLTCNDQFSNPISSTIYVNQGNLPESVSLSNTAVVGNLTTLTWSTVNVAPNSCVPSSSPAIPSWNFPPIKADNGSQSNVSVPSSAPAFTTYTLTCTGAYSGDPIAVSILLNENSGNVFNKVQPKYEEN